MELSRDTNETLANFYPSDVSKAAQQIFNGGDDNLFIGTGGIDYQFTTSAVQPFAQILTLPSGGDLANFTLKDVMDTEIPRESAETLLKSTMIQGIHQKVMTSLSDIFTTTFTGTVSYTKDILHAKALSTGVLSILAIALIFVAPRKPSINGSAGSLLATAAALRSNPVQKANTSTKYFTRDHPKSGVQSIVTLVPVDNLESRSSISFQTDEKYGKVSEWWLSAGSRDPYVAVAVVLCLIIVRLLELIQRLSDQHNGFMAIASTGVDSSILSQYIPTVMFISLILIFGDIEMLTASFSPFATLKKGRAMASPTLNVNYLTKSGPHAFISSLVNCHFALAMILITTLVASFLTIVILGLYTHQNNPFEANTTLIIADKFNYRDADISGR